MTKAKAVEILNQRYDEYVFIQRLRFSDESDVINRMIALLTAIDALEQNPDGGWISMKDRRPEPETWAMVYIKYPSSVFELERGIRKTSSIKKMFYDGESFYCNFGTITHWQPLPQKPESEADAE